MPSFLQGVFLQSLRNCGKKAPRTLNPSHKILENCCKKQHFSNMNKIEISWEVILLFYVWEPSMPYFGKTSKTFSYFCQVFYKVSFCQVWEIAVKRHHGRWILVTKFLKIHVKNNIFQTWIKSKNNFFILLFFIFENIRCHTCGKMKRKYFLYFEFFIRCLLIVAHFEKLR